MARYSLTHIVHRGLGLSETNKLSSNNSTLVHQLVKAVLAIRAGLSENDGTGVHSSVKSETVLGYCFAVTFHIKLLDVGRES